MEKLAQLEFFVYSNWSRALVFKAGDSNSPCSISLLKLCGLPSES